MPFPNTHPMLFQALEAKGYAEPTPVQAAIIDAPLGADLLVSAQTGSGKTVAFGLAAADTLLGDQPKFGRAEAPLALVIAPTRELALQVSRELEWLYKDAGAHVVTCVGGMDARREQRELSLGAHMVVGTPGRLRDHLERGNLDLSTLRVIVLDEADEMLDMGFREDLEEILDATPPDRRTLMFSATIAKDIALLAKRFQRDAVRIDTVSRAAHADIDYRAIRVAPNELELAVVNVLRYFEEPGALVFCATREAVRHLHGALRERGFQAVALSGEMSQKERSDALQSLRDGHARACVATDVAARGLDLPDLGLVIHAELPQNKAALLHRSGRTGRAGKKGVSVLLVPYTKRRKAEQLLASANIDPIWSGPPSAEEIRAKDQQRLLDDPILNEASSDEDLALAKKLLEGRAPETIAAALIRLHRARLPAPEEMYDDVRDGARPDVRPATDRRRDSLAPINVTDGAWFRLTVGRQNNADPKWLIPLICRLGHVTKKDIGQIRIFDRETKFEIARDAEPRFREAIKAAAASGDMRIEPGAPPPAAGPRPPRGPRPDHAPPAREEAYVPRTDAAPPSAKPPFKRPSDGFKGPKPGGFKGPRADGFKGPKPDGFKGGKPDGFKRKPKPAGRSDNAGPKPFKGPPRG